MIRSCAGCIHWDTDTMCIEDKRAQCNCTVVNEMTVSNSCCPGFTEPETGSIMIDRLTMIFGMMGHETSSTIPEPGKPAEPRSPSGKQVVERDTDYESSITLFEHQKNAREKFKDKDEIALFFEMGCGKSLTSMMIVADKYKAGKIDSLLIVAPNGVHKQWFNDLCDDDSVLSKALEQEGVESTGQIIGGRGGQKCFYKFDDDNLLHIVCVNIDTFSTPHKWEPIADWVNTNNTAIIIDEATTIKNPTSKRSERMLYAFNDVVRNRNRVIGSFKKPNTQVRIVLTGTPVTNGPIDLWSIMEFIKPNYFNRNYYSFTNYYGMHTKLTVNNRTISILLTPKTWREIRACPDYATAYEQFGCSEDTYLTIKSQDVYHGPYKHADELKQLLEPNAVFAKLVDCVDMPATNYIVKKVELSEAQQSCYSQMREELLATYDDKVATASNKMVMSLRLQQISSGFMMTQQQELDDDAPFWAEPDTQDITPTEVTWLDNINPRLEQLLRDVDELDKPILIITRFSAEAAKIYELLKDKYSTCLITGWKTVGSIEDFKAGKFEIMVANLAKIAYGHNLQIAHTTIYYSNSFSMEHRQQSEFRTFRIGQKYPCTYIDYESCGIDRTINAALKLKKGLLEYIREKKLEELI